MGEGMAEEKSLLRLLVTRREGKGDGGELSEIAQALPGSRGRGRRHDGRLLHRHGHKYKRGGVGAWECRWWGLSCGQER